MSPRRRALVTGAGGFVGSHLVERLARDGWSVRAFVRYTSAGRAGWLDRSGPRDERVEIVAGDVRDGQAVRDVDVVFHLAALVGIPYSHSHPREVVDELSVPDIARRLLGERLPVRIHRSRDYWLDVGHPQDYARACEDFAARRDLFLPLDA